jgi:hypothetical protein
MRMGSVTIVNPDAKVCAGAINLRIAHFTLSLWHTHQ